jgi:hypothetical protein
MNNTASQNETGMKNPMNNQDRMRRSTIAMIRNNRKTDRIFLVVYHITVNLASSDHIIL